MKRWTPAAAVLASAALIVAAALPADAATTSIAVTDATGPAAVDVLSNRVYVGTTPADPGPVEHWNSSAGVAQVDLMTKKVVKSVTVLTLLSYAIGAGVSDVEVSPTSKDLWVLVGAVTTGYGCYATLYQLDKNSLASVRKYDLGCTRKIELDPTSRLAYLTEAPLYNDVGDDAQPVTPATVVVIDGASGTVRRADIPAPTRPVFSITEDYQPTSIAFNLRNRRLYVVGQGSAWVYSTKLALLHTTELGYGTDKPLSAAANPVTNQIYVADRDKVTELSGRTDEVTRTSVLSGDSSMVIDPRATVLYRGTNTINLDTLRSVGQQKRVIQAVNPFTRTRYSVGSGQLYAER
ncbi:MAG TPA: hypothetical protein VIT20_08660 [Propionibacteriaceae bacterium]